MKGPKRIYLSPHSAGRMCSSGRVVGTVLNRILCEELDRDHEPYVRADIADEMLEALEAAREAMEADDWHKIGTEEVCPDDRLEHGYERVCAAIAKARSAQ